MYGSIQAPRAWFKTFLISLFELGYQQSAADPCVFFRYSLGREKKFNLIIIIYVDDTILVGTRAAVKSFKNVNKYYNIKDLGPLKKHLEVWHEKGEDQDSPYLQGNMEKFHHQLIADFEEAVQVELKPVDSAGFLGK